MLKEPAYLKSLINSLLTLTDTGILNDKHLTGAITCECVRIKTFVFEISQSGTNDEYLRQELNELYAKLVGLTNLVTAKLGWESLDVIPEVHSEEGEVHPLTYILYCLTDLLNYSETTFKEIIGQEQPAPDFYLLKMRYLLSLKLSGIKKDLADKKIPGWMISEIENGLNHLIKRKKPALRYRDYRYFQIFTSELTVFISEQRERDAPQSILHFLTDLNFNYSGFYNKWADNFLSELKKAVAPEAVSGLIDAAREQVTLPSPVTGIIYDPNSPGLSELLRLFLTEQGQFMTEQS